MDDYISREVTVNSLNRLCERVCQYSKARRRVMCSSCPLGDAFTVIEDDIPAADVRPVVLCRDCVYYNTTGCADGFGWCEGVMVSKGTSDDFFCAEGKQNPYECGAEMKRNLDATKGDNHD